MEREINSVVLDAIKKIETVSERKPCKKTVQKIVYLIEEAGESLGFNYTIHFYGPYSADLDYEIQNLASKGLLDIEYTKYGHNLSAVPSEESIAKLDQTGDSIIEKFGKASPSELELLATTLFVQRNIKSSESQKVVYGVKKIKGSKYSDQQIDSAIEKLKKCNYF